MRVTSIILCDDNTQEEMRRSVESAKSSNIISVCSDKKIDFAGEFPNLFFVENKYKIEPYRNMVNLLGRHWKETDTFNIIHCPNYDKYNKLERSLEIFEKNVEVSLVYTDAELDNGSIKHYNSFNKLRIQPSMINPNFVFKKVEGLNMEPVNANLDPFFELIMKITQNSLAYHIAEPLTHFPN